MVFNWMIFNPQSTWCGCTGSLQARSWRRSTTSNKTILVIVWKLALFLLFIGVMLYGSLSSQVWWWWWQQHSKHPQHHHCYHCPNPSWQIVMMVALDEETLQTHHITTTTTTTIITSPHNNNYYHHHHLEYIWTFCNVAVRIIAEKDMIVSEFIINHVQQTSHQRAAHGKLCTFLSQVTC